MVLMKRLQPIHNVSAPSYAYENALGKSFFTASTELRLDRAKPRSNRLLDEPGSSRNGRFSENIFSFCAARAGSWDDRSLSVPMIEAIIAMARRPRGAFCLAKAAILCCCWPSPATAPGGRLGARPEHQQAQQRNQTLAVGVQKPIVACPPETLGQHVLQHQA